MKKKITILHFPLFFFFFLKPFTCVSTRTSSPWWRSTPCSPSAPQWTGLSAHARRPSSSWSPWRVWTRDSSSSTRIWPWRSSPGIRRRTAVRWSEDVPQRGAFKQNTVRKEFLTCFYAAVSVARPGESFRKLQLLFLFPPNWMLRWFAWGPVPVCINPVKQAHQDFFTVHLYSFSGSIFYLYFLTTISSVFFFVFFY